jgi:DUF4097 and DUF4098 domain-containing protein YvlB
MKQNLKKLILKFALLTVILVPLAAKSSHKYETELTKTYEVKTGTKLTVSNRNGKIEIEKWDKDEVEVFTKIGSNKSMKELEKVNIEVSLEEGIEVSTTYSGEESKENKNDFGIWDFIKKVLKGSFIGEKVCVDYEIKVPGHVIVSEAKTTNGRIQLKQTKGPSELHTTNGEIKVETAEGNIEAKTTNGRIQIEDVKGLVSAKSTNGPIKVNSEKIEEIKTTNGNIDAKLKELIEGETEFRTTNGSITLNLPSSLNATLELSTTNGGIDLKNLDLDIISQNKNKYIKGKIGEGEKEISARTTNGNIKVYKL